MKEISVSLENWRKILKLKKEFEMKHNNDVISYLFRISSIDKKTSENDDNIKKEEKHVSSIDKKTSENGDLWDI